MNIGDRLRKLRSLQGLTAKELSELSGVPEKTIYRIETGEVEDPKISSIKPIIKALKCSADDLLFDEKTEGLSGVLKNYLEKAFQLPASEKLAIIHIIEKFILANQLRNLSDSKIPKEIFDYWENNKHEFAEIDEMTEGEQADENSEEQIKHFETYK